MENNSSFGRRIIEIISFLVKELLEEDKDINGEEQLVDALLEQGYNLEEINMAFALIFSLEGKIEKNYTDKEQENYQAKRFLTILEKTKLTLSAQGLLIRLSEAKLVTPHEIERILSWVMQRNEEVNLEDLWYIVEKVIDNDLRFILLTNHEWTVELFLGEEEKKGFLN